MKALLINSKTKEISTILLDGSLHDIASHLGANLVQIYHEFENGDVIHVDDEAPARKGLKTWFMISGAKHPFPGNGIVLGTTDGGYDTDARLSLEMLQKQVMWLSDEEVKKGWPDFEWQHVYFEKPTEEEKWDKYYHDAEIAGRGQDHERDFVYRNYFKI